jgi:hypothetical protein
MYSQVKKVIIYQKPERSSAPILALHTLSGLPGREWACRLGQRTSTMSVLTLVGATKVSGVQISVLSVYSSTAWGMSRVVSAYEQQT